MFRRRTVYIFLCLVATILVGTVIVLSSISFYLHIDTAAYITETELGDIYDGTIRRWNATEHGKVEVVPRILHQTWKSETLPEKWAGLSQECREMMPDYEYKLWTDASSREFIAREYPWFLDTFDGYHYPIQRADSIRYFVLYHYGGIYMDLDMGCRRPMDSLLTFPVIIPRTKPVGVSNDLMTAEKNHPFWGQVIHNLMAWDYNWVLNYPTVMFGTGPMFLSAQYSYWTSLHPPTKEHPGGEVRILPKSLYGKNAQAGEAPHSFFIHYYGSSWHADDAAFIGFLGQWGKILMWIVLVALIIGVIRLVLAPHTRQRKYSLGRFGGYEVIMPRWKRRNHRWYLNLGWFAVPSSATNSPTPASPISGSSEDEEEIHLLPLSIADVPPSPALSDSSSNRTVVGAMQRAANGVRTLFTSDTESRPSRARRSSRRSGSVLFYLPAFLTPSNVEMPADRSFSHSFSRYRGSRSRSVSPHPHPEYPSDKFQSGDTPLPPYPGPSSSSNPDNSSTYH